MKRFAVEIGKIILTSDEPITEEERKEADAVVRKRRVIHIDGWRIELTVNSH